LLFHTDDKPSFLSPTIVLASDAAALDRVRLRREAGVRPAV
jgi:hypothetical protein